MEETLSTELDYVSGSSSLPDGVRGISPSSINNFVTKPHEWYREHILKQGGFAGSTASVLGTVCHYCAEQFGAKGTVNKSEIYNYIFQQCVLGGSVSEWLELTEEDDKVTYLEEHCNNPEIDGSIILDQWKPMGQAIIHYLTEEGKPDRVEEMISTELMPGYAAAGSADAVKGTVLVDYKTTSEKTPKKYIPMNYKYQLLTYAYIYNKLGIKIDRIRIVWITRNETGRVSETTGKALKDYPSQAVEVTQEITFIDMQFIEGILKLMAETIQAGIDHPELLHVLWKDYRLKV